jgi:hypothetical protein
MQAMTRNTPLLTLLTGAALALGLIVTSSIATAQDFKSRKASAASASTAPASPAAVSPTAVSPAATASPAAKVNAVWAGHTDGGAASIAISVKDGVAIAYVCDGRHEIWLQGTAADGKLALTSAKGATLTGTFGGGKATGTVVAGSVRYSFIAPAVTKPSGLYRATAEVRNAKVVGGWIVLPDGSQVGVVTRDGVEGTAPPIDPATGRVTVDGTDITANPVEEALS